METKYRFQYGPIETEVTVAEEDNDVEAVGAVLEALQDIEDEHHLGTLDEVRQPIQTDEDVVENNPQVIDGDIETDQVSASRAQSIDAEIESAARQCQVDPIALVEHINIDPDREYLPFIAVEANQLGSTQTERQMRASLCLLYILDTCYEQEQVASSDLKDVLEISGIPSDSMYNIYEYSEQQYFDRSGRGANATIGLTRPGFREARNVIQNLIQSDEMDEDGSNG